MMMCLGLGSIPLFISNLQIGNLFIRSELVLSTINGIFDAGDGLTIVPKYLAEKIGMRIHVWWMVFMGATIFFFFRTFLLMPVMFFDKNSPEKTGEEEEEEEANPENESLRGDDVQSRSQEEVSSKQLVKILLGTRKFLPFLAMFLLTDLREKKAGRKKNPSKSGYLN